MATSAGRSSEASPNAYYFSWCYQGSCTCQIANKTCKLDYDNVVLYQPGQTFRTLTDPLEPVAGYFFGFLIEKFNSEWPPREKWPVSRRLPRNDLIRPLFEYVMANGPVDTGGGEVPLAMVAAIELMLTEFILGPTHRKMTLPHTYPQPVQRLLEWIFEFMNNRITEKVSLSEMAEVSGVCGAHLCRLCKEHLGYAPVDLVYVYRLTRSLSRLGVGQKIETISHDLGFASAAHYTRRFEQLFGRSPRQLRKEMAKGYRPKLPKLPYMQS